MGKKEWNNTGRCTLCHFERSRNRWMDVRNGRLSRGKEGREKWTVAITAIHRELPPLPEFSLISRARGGGPAQ